MELTDVIQLFFIFLSDSQPAGYLPYYLELGHGPSCKHVEIPYQVSTADTHDAIVFLIDVILSVKTEEPLGCKDSCNFVQTESEVSVIGGGTSTSR